MLIEIEKCGILKVNNIEKRCMYDINRYCNVRCAHFSEPYITQTHVVIYICHGKDWKCELKEFTDKRIKVLNA